MMMLSLVRLEYVIPPLCLLHMFLGMWVYASMQAVLGDQRQYFDLRLHLVIVTLIFTLPLLWLLPRLRGRFRFYPVWMYFSYALGFFLLYGVLYHNTEESDRGCGTTRNDFWVITLSRESSRYHAFQGRAMQQGLDPQVYLGRDWRKVQNETERARLVPSFITPDAFYAAVYSLTYRQVLLQALHTNEAADWIVVFEDDAVPMSRFVPRLESLECRARFETDMLWFDTRDTVENYFLGTFQSGLAGAAYRVQSIERIAALIALNDSDPFYGPWRRLPGIPNNAKAIPDIIMAHACHRGVLQCEYAPLVRESGQISSLQPGVK